MPNPTWPTTLPEPLNGQASFAPLAPNVIETGMETGAPKRRRRFTSVPEKVSVVIQVNATQKGTLDTFVVTTLADVGVFDWTDWRDSSTATYYFASRPTYQHVSGSVGLWEATLELVKQ